MNKEGWVDDVRSRIFVLLRYISLEHILRVIKAEDFLTNAVQTNKYNS